MDEYDRQPIFGTTEKIDVIKPTANSLREIKKRVKAGEIVSICIDHCEPIEGWKRLDIPERQIYISEAIFRFAERLEIPLVFFATRVNSKNEIEIHTARPVSKRSNEVTTEFTEFLKRLLSAPNN
jgi:lauroyl/myristoyl acyltransferase